jgi:hypothetical protein
MKLLNCPFCGAEADIGNWCYQKQIESGQRNLSVFCENEECGAEICEDNIPKDYVDKVIQQLIKRWNTRHE